MPQTNYLSQEIQRGIYGSTCSGMTSILIQKASILIVVAEKMSKFDTRQLEIIFGDSLSTATTPFFDIRSSQNVFAEGYDHTPNAHY